MKTKRIIASVMALSLILSLTVGCNKSADKASEDGKVTITIGNWANPESNPKDYERSEKRRAVFMEKNSDINVETDEFQYDPQVFMARAEGGTLPTLYTPHFTEAKMLIKNNYVADLTKELKERGYYEMLNEYVIEDASSEGKIFLVPQSCYTMGLIINLDLFEQAGLVAEDGTPIVPETYDELAEISKTITEKTGKAGLVFPTTGNFGGWYFSMLGWAFGVDFMEQIDGKWTATFDSPETIDALNYLKKLKWEDGTMPVNALIAHEDMLQMVATGEAAMTFGHPGQVDMLTNDYAMNKDSVGYAKIPAGPKGRFTLMGGTYYALRSDSTPEQISACFDWMEFIGITPNITDENLIAYEDSLKSKIERGGIAGIEDLSVWNEKSNATQKKQEVAKNYINVNMNHIKSYNDKSGIEYRTEEPVCAQSLYGILDGVLQEILSNKNADIEKLVKDANQNMQKNYLDYEN